MEEVAAKTGESTCAGDAAAAATAVPQPEAVGAAEGENPKEDPKHPQDPAEAPPKIATTDEAGGVKPEVGGAQGAQGAEGGQGQQAPTEGEEGAAPFNTVLDFLSSLLTKNYKEALRLSKNILKYEPKNKTVSEFLNVLEEVVAGGLLEDSECSSSGSEDSSDASSGSDSSESEDSSESSEDSSDEEEDRSLAYMEAEARNKHCGPDLDLESVLTTPSTVCKCKCRRHRHEPPQGRHSKKHFEHTSTPTTRVHKNSHHHSHRSNKVAKPLVASPIYNQEHHVHEPQTSRFTGHAHFARANSPGASVISEATGVSGATGVFTVDNGCGESVMADNDFLTGQMRESSSVCPPQNHHCCCAHHQHSHHPQQHHRRHHCSKTALLRSMESRLNTPQVRNCLLRTAPDEEEAAMMRRALWAVAEAATFDSCGDFAPPAFDASMLGLPGSRLCSPELQPMGEVHRMNHQNVHNFGGMMPEDLQSVGSFQMGSNASEASSSSSSSRSGPSPNGFGDAFREEDGENCGGYGPSYGPSYGQEGSFGDGSFGESFSMSTFDEEDDEEEDDDDDDGDSYNVGVLGAMPAPPLKSILKGSNGCPRHRFFRDEVRFDESALVARGVGSSSSSCSTASSHTTDDGYSS